MVHTGSSSERARQAGSFGAAAAVYERARPSYPPAAVEWLVPPGARRVVDLGAGTGKLTRSLVARGLDVSAVEPSDGMRAELRRAVPEAEVLAGSAETLPLPDGRADAVLVAQAWHWVDPARAVPEVARVLAPGGTLALVWNVRDDREDWVTRLDALLHPAGDQHTSGAQLEPLRTHFEPLEEHTVRWESPLTPDGLVDLVASRSYVLLLPSDRRAELLAAVRELTATHPALRGRERFPMPYVTECFRTRQAMV